VGVSCRRPTVFFNPDKPEPNLKNAPGSSPYPVPEAIPKGVGFQDRAEGSDMEKLEGLQRKYLRGLAHRLKPVVFIGQKGLTPEVLSSAGKALERHELIKVKFNDFKGKDEKTEISGRIAKETGAENVGMIGHTVVFYRQQEDPEKRNISLPQRKG
jgi:RNA-binding protein